MTFENNAPPPRKPRVFKVDDIAEEKEHDDEIEGIGAATPRRSEVPRDA